MRDAAGRDLRLVGVGAAARGSLRAPRRVLHPRGQRRLVGPRARRALRARPADAPQATDAWIPGDELFVPCRHSDGHLLGIVSVGEPVSGMRPSDDQLDLLVAMVSLTARALQGAQEAVEAARHRTALEQLLQVSSRLSERRSIDEVLQEVCDGVAGALDFQKVMIELVDPETGVLMPRAVAGWDDVSHAPQWRVSVDEIRPLLRSRLRGRGLLPRPADGGHRAHAAAHRLHLDHERARPARVGPPLARGPALRPGRARSSGASGPTTRPTGCCPRPRGCRPCACSPTRR